jgi:hypothetical protein
MDLSYTQSFWIQILFGDFGRLFSFSIGEILSSSPGSPPSFVARSVHCSVTTTASGVLPHQWRSVASLVPLHLRPERPDRAHDLHYHQHDPPPPLLGVSPYQLLGRSPTHSHPPPQPPPIQGSEPPNPPLRPIRHDPLLRPPSCVRLCLLFQHFRHWSS